MPKDRRFDLDRSGSIGAMVEIQVANQRKNSYEGNAKDSKAGP